MASKILCFVAVLCALQYADAASVQKRTILGDIRNVTDGVLALVQQQVAADVAQAKALFEGVAALVAQGVSNAIADIEKKAASTVQGIEAAVTTAVKIGKNIEPCVSKGKDAVRTVFTAAAAELHTCAQNAAGEPNATFADLLGLNYELQQLPAQLLGCLTFNIRTITGCVANAIAVITPRALRIASDASFDLLKLGTEAAQVPGRLAECAVDGTQYAATEFANISQTVESCILTVS